MIDRGQNRLDYRIVSELAKEMIPKFNRGTASEAVPLHHPDLSVNNIFVDDDLHITCVIDWGFASSVPFAELLAAPGMPYPRCLADPSFIATFRPGFEEKAGRVKSQFWEDSGKGKHFQLLIFMDSMQDYRHFEELYKLVYKPDQPVNIAALVRKQHTFESNQKEPALFCKEDRCIADVDRGDRECFVYVLNTV